MTKTLDTLIAAARGALDLHGATSDATLAARAVATTCATLAGDEGVEIVISAPPVAARVAAEQHLVERILAPLVENGCRHASERLHLLIRARPTSVEIFVQDDGDGFPAEDLERIFAPGWQGPSGDHGATQVIGAGLGLALARRLARSAGGEVRAERSDTGARLVVALPRDGASLI
jgi:signal transduction histidine kinase